MAVTLLRCSSEWEWLSTHYSSDLGGQLEESSINQTVAQAEADDSRQQCSKQPLYPTHQWQPLQPSTSHRICAHSLSLCIPIFSVSTISLVFAAHSLFFTPSSSLYASNPLWLSSYKQWINPSPPCVNGLLNISHCLWICQQHLHWIRDGVSCLLATHRCLNMSLLVFLSSLLGVLYKWLVGSRIQVFDCMCACVHKKQAQKCEKSHASLEVSYFSVLFKHLCNSCHTLGHFEPHSRVIASSNNAFIFLF